MSKAFHRLQSISKAMAFSSSSQYDLKTIQSMRKSYKSSLSDFATSGSAFKILCSIPQEKTKLPVNTLYVLDSSYNPPTKAHMHLAKSALKGRVADHCRILLLLAIKNADKAPKPAQFEDRLVMMTLMAEELQKEQRVAVDVGVTTEPFYYKKAEVVEASGEYAGLQSQVHITGFDTVIRIFDGKYYPDGMGVLGGMFEKGSLRVHLRDGDEEEQRGYLQKIADGEREGEGIKQEWAERIEMVEPMEEVVSSTEARKCVLEQRGLGLERYVSGGVRDYIMQEGLYEEEQEG
jgi:nicotinamide-nucleotide adenylyltransferase